MDEVYEPLRQKLQFKSEIVCCACCEKPLVTVYIPEIPAGPMTYIFKCPFCKEESFKKTYDKKIWFEPINCFLFNVINDKIITVELTDGKNNSKKR